VRFDVKGPALLVGAAILAYVGWAELHGDDALRAEAAEVACQERVCQPELEKRTKDLFGWTFLYLIHGDRTHTVTVSCEHEFWVVGPYRCGVAESNSAVDERFR
jgi:hypothetical protein